MRENQKSFETSQLESYFELTFNLFMLLMQHFIMFRLRLWESLSFVSYSSGNSSSCEESLVLEKWLISTHKAVEAERRECIVLLTAIEFATAVKNGSFKQIINIKYLFVIDHNHFNHISYIFSWPGEQTLYVFRSHNHLDPVTRMCWLILDWLLLMFDWFCTGVVSGVK